MNADPFDGPPGGVDHSRRAHMARSLRLGRLLLGLMRPWHWPRLALYLAGAAVAQKARIQSLRGIRLPFRGLILFAPWGSPAGLKFLIEIAAMDVYGSLRRDHMQPTKPTLIYDVGANAGVFAILECLRDASLQAVCFEPRPETFQVLVRNVDLNGLSSRIRCEPIALSNRDGEVPLGLPPGSSMGVVRDEGATDLTGSVLNVPSRRLDTYAQEHGPPDVLKIDVEGHELQVLDGMGDLAPARIGMEAHTRALFGGARTGLEAMGFEVATEGNLLFASRPT